ncbi:MAG: riboflavin biosynthesis protein RibF [Defluviitaleaceae bacterium]|nr:riboflavin biosynthesis protein RibF [Defluviitaleaceae bacterium]
MRYINSHKIDGFDKPSVVMLGNFDGMHMGHLALFEALANLADQNNAETVVFSLWPHPLTYLGAQDFGLLLTSREKVRILDELGANVFIEYPFDDALRNMPPERFVEDILVDGLHACAIVIGDDYAFGKNREGNPDFLRKLGTKLGFDVHVVSPVTDNGERVSSRTIRKYIATKDLARASDLMMRPYQLSGIVIYGRQLGRTLGFPTINIMPPPEKLLPPYGVYLTSTTILDGTDSTSGQTYESVTNIGLRPTIAKSDESVIICESYLYAFNQDIYGKEVVINFYEGIRGERKFKNVDALKRQVEIDIETGKMLWKKSRLQ